MTERIRGDSGESIRLRPHQVALVEQILGMEAPARILVSSHPGTGKSVAIATALRELRDRRPAEWRCLLVVPAGLERSWQILLSRHAGLDAEVIDLPAYRLLEVEAPSSLNLWRRVSCGVVSIDFLKVGLRLNEILAVAWDAVVLDESQLCSGGTKRESLARTVWESRNVHVGLALSNRPGHPGWLLKDHVTRTVTWSRDSLRDWNGQSVFPKRRLEVVRYKPSEAEQRFSLSLSRVLASLSGGDQTANLVANTLQRRWSSCPYAIEQSLRRRVASSVKDRSASLDAPDEWFAWFTPAPASPMAQPATEECWLLLRQLEEMPSDAKWMACKDLLRRLVPAALGPITIFSDFADTVEYVALQVEREGWPVSALSGRLSAEERWRRSDQLRREGRGVIVASTATEGGLPWVSEHSIHYDVPWDARRLVERFWRIESAGTPFSEACHYFLLKDGTGDEAVLDRLTRRVWQLEREGTVA